MSQRNTTAPHRISKNNGKVCDMLTDYCLFRCGIKIKARLDGGNLMIETPDYADWLLARQAAREQFGFEQGNIVREL